METVYPDSRTFKSEILKHEDISQELRQIERQELTLGQTAESLGENERQEEERIDAAKAFEQIFGDAGFITRGVANDKAGNQEE